MAAACGAAAAVIIGVAALAGAFSGPSGQPGQSGQHQTSQASGTSSHRATSSVLGTATAPPTPRPSATSPATLCNQYMDFLKHPGQHANRTAEEDAVVQQLTKLANGKMRIFGYCIRQLGMGEWHGYDTRFPGGEGDPGGGDPSGRGGSGEPGAKSTSAGPLKAGQTAR